MRAKQEKINKGKEARAAYEKSKPAPKPMLGSSGFGGGSSGGGGDMFGSMFGPSSKGKGKDSDMFGGMPGFGSSSSSKPSKPSKHKKRKKSKKGKKKGKGKSITIHMN